MQLAEQVHDLVPGPHVDARRGLVQQQEVGLGQQGPGEEHALLLTAGQRPDVPAGEVADAEAVEHPGDVALLVPRRPRQDPTRTRDISTHCATDTGKSQSIRSTWGT